MSKDCDCISEIFHESRFLQKMHRLISAQCPHIFICDIERHILPQAAKDDNGARIAQVIFEGEEIKKSRKLP